METSFSDSKVLGKFHPEVAPVQSEELKSAYQEIEKLKADLLECREFIEPYVDVVDGDYGEPAPNKAMRLVSMIDESLHGPGNF